MGTVYFLRDGAKGPIKIGWTAKTVPARVAGLQTGNPRQLTMLGRIDGADKACEAHWHRRFRDVRLAGEWFAPTADLISAMRAAPGYVPMADGSLPPQWVLDLQAWMKRADLSVEAFAKVVGFKESYAREIVFGRCFLSLPAAKKIEAASGGELAAVDLLETTCQTLRIRAFMQKHRASSQGASRKAAA